MRTIDEVLDRLTSSDVDPEVADHLERVFGAAEVAVEANHAATFLRAVTVEGFRGIGPKQTLELKPKPGLTLVVGRNGSGKSSFVEGLEVALRGDSARWRGRVKVWQEGWRNLHQPEPSSVSATFHIEGEGTTTVAREWAAKAKVDGATSYAQRHGQARTAVDDLGWETALEATPPLLSYNELGSLLESGPSKLYDTIAPLLGLEVLADAADQLRQDRLHREKAYKAAKASADELIERLGSIDDSRAVTAADLLGAKAWNLDGIENLAMGSGTPPANLAALSTVANLAVAADAPSRFGAFVAAKEKVDALSGTSAARAAEHANLLADAVAFHEQHQGHECPVCSQGLPDGWLDQTRAAVEQLWAEAAEHTAAVAAAGEAFAHLSDAVPRLPDNVGDLEADDARLAAGAWASALEHPETVGEHRDTLTAAVASIITLRDAAQQRVGELEEAWRPIATDIVGWVADARPAAAGNDEVPALKQAEAWVADTTDAIRAERFAPIAERARALWEMLSLRSNVALDDVVMSGKTTNRRVDLSVSVDGTDGAALSVMSQGELHSLALSLFLPRATREQSPFRFVVIDDPVQAMDPSRVGGLARVLHEIAQTHQVVVFTHDDRLRTAVWRLDIPATVIEVTRREGSVVDLREIDDPVARTLDDAIALANTDTLPPDIALEVVPGYCRTAVEAACHEVVWLRRADGDVPHHQTEEELSGLKLSQTLSNALFDTADDAGKVLTRLNEWGRWAGDLYVALNKGAHGGYQGSLGTLAFDTKKLCNKLRELA